MQYSSLLRPLVSYKENEVIWIQLMRTYSQHFIFFITYEWVQQGRVFVPGMFLQPSVMKHPSSLHPLVSYKENGALWIWLLRQYSQHFIFFITYKWLQQEGVFVPGKPFQPSANQHPSLLRPFVSYKENGKFLNTTHEPESHYKVLTMISGWPDIEVRIY